MWEKRQILLIFAICKKQIDEYIMMEDYKKEDFDRLKNEVETLVGRKIVSPRDFDFLSRQIEVIPGNGFGEHAEASVGICGMFLQAEQVQSGIALPHGGISQLECVRRE